MTHWLGKEKQNTGLTIETTFPNTQVEVLHAQGHHLLLSFCLTAKREPRSTVLKWRARERKTHVREGSMGASREFSISELLNECKLRKLVSQQVMERGTGFLCEAF